MTTVGMDVCVGMVVCVAVGMRLNIETGVFVIVDVAVMVNVDVGSASAVWVKLKSALDCAVCCIEIRSKVGVGVFVVPMPFTIERPVKQTTQKPKMELMRIMVLRRVFGFENELIRSLMMRNGKARQPLLD